MKWLLPIALLLLLVLFWSFARALESNIPSQPEVTAGPTSAPIIEPSPTIDALSPLLISQFNMAIEEMEFSTSINELEHIAGASYQVTGVDFQQGTNSSVVLRIKTRCECVENGSCCNYIRTFVFTIAILEKIYHHGTFQSPLTPPPGPISVLQVWCYDHADLTKVLSVQWTDVTRFFDDQIDGFQLWAEVTPES